MGNSSSGNISLSSRTTGSSRTNSSGSGGTQRRSATFTSSDGGNGDVVTRRVGSGPLVPRLGRLWGHSASTVLPESQAHGELTERESTRTCTDGNRTDNSSRGTRSAKDGRRDGSGDAERDSSLNPGGMLAGSPYTGWTLDDGAGERAGWDAGSSRSSTASTTEDGSRKTSGSAKWASELTPLKLAQRFWPGRERGGGGGDRPPHQVRPRGEGGGRGREGEGSPFGSSSSGSHRRSRTIDEHVDVAGTAGDTPVSSCSQATPEQGEVMTRAATDKPARSWIPSSGPLLPVQPGASLAADVEARMGVSRQVEEKRGSSRAREVWRKRLLSRKGSTGKEKEKEKEKEGETREAGKKEGKEARR